MRRYVAVSVVSLLASTALGQTNDLRKDAVVTVTIPRTLLMEDGRLLGALYGGKIFRSTVVEASPGVLTIDGNRDWRLAGLPSMFTGKVEKITRKMDAKPPFVEAEIRSIEQSPNRPFGAVKIRMTSPGLLSDQGAVRAFSGVTLSGPKDSLAATTYRRQLFLELADKFFTGTLATLPQATRMRLLEFLDTKTDGTTFTSEDFKGATYFAVDVGIGNLVFNENRMNQSARIAAVLNTHLLAVLKAFASLVGDAPQLFGLKLAFKIPYRDFLENTYNNLVDSVQIYAQAELIKRFDEADITNQQFIDGCIVIADGNRVEVNLSATTP